MLHRGRHKTKEPILGDIRSIQREDLALLAEKREEGTIINRLRDPHHRIARAVASGLKHVEISALLGVSANRISTLLKDPAFNDLVSKYRGQIDEGFFRNQDHFMEMATANMLMAESMLREKLEAAEENGEFLPTKDLLAISRDAADRFGYGKRNMNLNVNVDFAANLEAAMRRSGRVIEHRSAGTAVGDTAPQPSESEMRDVSPLPRRA